jgi:hypothetical protein
MSSAMMELRFDTELEAVFENAFAVPERHGLTG